MLGDPLALLTSSDVSEAEVDAEVDAGFDQIIARVREA